MLQVDPGTWASKSNNPIGIDSRTSFVPLWIGSWQAKSQCLTGLCLGGSIINDSDCESSGRFGDAERFAFNGVLNGFYCFVPKTIKAAQIIDSVADEQAAHHRDTIPTAHSLDSLSLLLRGLDIELGHATARDDPVPQIDSLAATLRS